MPTPIPHFLLPRGLPTARTLRTLQRQHRSLNSNFSTTSAVSRMNKAKPETRKNRILEKPDKFRPPSHPQRIVSPAARTPSGQPVNYGPRLTAKEREEQDKKQYPSMFPPEGTVMFKFLTSRWIHVWIAMVSGLLSLICLCPLASYLAPQIPNSHGRYRLRLLTHDPEHPNNPRNIHLHHKLQSNLPLRTPPSPLVRPPHQPLRDYLSGSERLPDARAT